MFGVDIHRACDIEEFSVEVLRQGIPRDLTYTIKLDCHSYRSSYDREKIKVGWAVTIFSEDLGMLRDFITKAEAAVTQAKEVLAMLEQRADKQS